MDGRGQIDEPIVDAEEMGRRLRAFFIAMQGAGVHTDTLRRYEAIRNEVADAAHDPTDEGSWGWWANHLGLADAADVVIKERERTAIVEALRWVRGLLRAKGYNDLIDEMADPDTAARQLRP